MIYRIRCRSPDPIRCTSTGRKCDGYAQPKQDYQTQVISQSRASRVQNAVPMLSGFGDNVHYLEFYHYCAGPTLSSADRFDTEFWSRISLQMAHSEPAVRHALIALGYLNKQETGSLKHARLGFTNDCKTFWPHYNKAVRHLVERMAEPSYSPEIGLVTCVLFVCIEFLRADIQTAFTHLRSGLKIISELRQRHHTDSPRQLPGAIQNGSTAPMDMIEDKLMPMFIRGMASALMFGLKVEDDFAILCPPPQSFQSRRFTSIREAQSSYHELRNATLIFARQMIINIIVLHINPATAEDVQRQNQFLECHRAWYRALEALECSQTWSSEDKVAISSLKVSYYATYVFVACATDAGQMSYDAHLDSFKALLHHAKIVLDSMHLGGLEAKPSSRAAAANFTFEISLIPSLFMVATRCRCPTTRREAVSLLALNPPREGLWDAEQHVIVSNRAMEMEEMEVDERGWPTENARLWSSVIEPNMDRTGGFWVHHCPAKWVGSVDETGRQRIIREYHVLEETLTDPLYGYVEPPRIAFSPNTAPLH